MTRNEALKMVEQLVRDFSADDVKDWLAEVCTVRARQEHHKGNTDEACEFMAFGNAVAAVRNRGV